MNKQRRYVLAISGGVDSMVLLDLVARDEKFRWANFPLAKFPADFVVAHFNHGIRGPEADRDEHFVRAASQRYGVTCVVGYGQLAAGCSEDRARQARWQFLDQVASRQPGGATVVTAHHSDDIIETVVMFTVRGTGWRGLQPLADSQRLHPLAEWSKWQIINYSIENDLTWVEDSTNNSLRYFRNRVRAVVASWSDDERQQLLQLIARQRQLTAEIDDSVGRLVAQISLRQNTSVIVRRYHLIMLPDVVALEVLRLLTGGQLTRPQLWMLLWFVRSAKPGKTIHWRKVQVAAAKTIITIQRSDNSSTTVVK